MNRQRKKNLLVAVAQMNSGRDKEKNLKKVIGFLKKAIDRGAGFILFPEMFNYRGDGLSLNGQEELIPGHSLRPLQIIAAKHKVWILAGSIFEKIFKSKKAYNSSVVIGSNGEIKAVYRKIHLFDVQLKDKKIQESKISLAGRKPVSTMVAGVKTGLTICYDLRFPELYRAYSKAGAEMLCVPSAFTAMTGKDHWEVLLRARAVENQCFVLAPNQCGINKQGIRAFGNSMIIDPWGRVMARGSTRREQIIYAKLDFSKLDAVRKNIPALKHRKL